MQKLLFSTLFFLGSWQLAIAQCDSLLTFRPIHIQGLLDGQPGNFSGLLLLKSMAGVALEAHSTPLEDEAGGQLLPNERISLSAQTLSIGAGKTGSLLYSVEGASIPGNYTGLLEVNQKGGSCHWEIPVTVGLNRKDQIQILENGQALSLKTVAPSWLNFILPASIRQEGINFRVENEGPTSVTMDSFSLALIGETTHAALTETFVNWENTDKNLHANELELLSFRFQPQNGERLKADQYQGEIRVYFKDYPEPLSLPLTVSARAGSFWVIVTLLLGILLGRLIKDLNRAQGQIALMRRLVSLRAEVELLSDKLAQKQLWDELSRLETDINGVFSDEAKLEVENKFPPLEKKIQQTRELEALFERMEEQFKTADASTEEKQQASQQFRLVRDMVLDGKETEAMEGLQKLNDMISAQAEKSKGFFDDLAVPAAEAMKRQFAKMVESLQGEGPGQQEGKVPGMMEKFFFQAMQLLSGVKISARVRYGFIRPLVTLATFTVLLLLGLNEIYIQAGDTFGAEGLLDYLKVFLWGVVSDVFSRSLTTDDAVASFLGK